MPPDQLTRGGDLGPGSARDEAIVAASRQREICSPRDWGVQEVGIGTARGTGGRGGGAGLEGKKQGDKKT